MVKKLVATIFTVLFFLSASFTASCEVSLKTVVIDAGHGGHDPGAVSPDRKYQEKEINLDVALKLGELIEKNCPDVKVIYTRKSDVYKTLVERSNIANRNNADLFISIHVNSARNSSANGTETFVMGTDKSNANMEVCKAENSVILLEDDYSTTYQGFDPDNAESYIFFNLMQNAYFDQSIAMASYVQQQFAKGPVSKSRGIKQAPLLVLWKTTMPSVLIEVGFLSNSSDRSVLVKAENRDAIANDIFEAFRQFKEQYDSHLEFDETEPVPQPHYSVQILVSSRKLDKGDPMFKGVSEVECRFINGMFKYTVGNFPSKEESAQKLSEMKRLFPDAFITFFED